MGAVRLWARTALDGIAPRLSRVSMATEQTGRRVQAFNEMFEPLSAPDSGTVREVYARLSNWLEQAPPELLAARRRQAEHFFRRIGITFAVYGDAEAEERLIPFDIVPRIIGRDEWTKLEGGLTQRAKALNMFLADVYGQRECVKAGIIPEDLILQNPQFALEMQGVRPPHGVFVHLAGIDLVRTGPDEFYVLEDNARTPSGVSYMLENREVMMRLFPELFAEHRIAPGGDLYRRAPGHAPFRLAPLR